MNEEVFSRMLVSDTSLNVRVSGLFPSSADRRNEGMYGDEVEAMKVLI